MSRSVPLDSVDLKILAALQNNARLPNKELAATVGIAPSTCLDRVNRLRETGVIVGYQLRVDPAKLDRPLEALLYVRMQPHRRPLVDPFVEHVLNQPETRELYHLTGPDDFLIHVAAENANALQRLVLDELTARDEIALVHTNLVFQRWLGGPLLPPDE
ncbi:DNA-binding Lrp family transcriptional regulator [Actinopolyspora lacussalsi]|uniref:DNA-binding transcriptional regulator, Lrp family n=2 Tax=Actinopolyspora alba group TaxID=2893675 RepID=A0A1I1VPY8_9ACTN|nr:MULTISPECIES: Lrp/AsnC family transcriptional regulator [Actinopolyspora alba group]MDP9643350.1 DNA-binding Lrp family transcriptional regulator [Actinopolyspora lacussalsi]SFD85056.1 DNA-binding transcriptional regulator, Lrp family [Actinopolyspora alba]SFT71225.1 DNA-binding transcriptional regulator, Lrp family [Actinopolyspora righensis]